MDTLPLPQAVIHSDQRILLHYWCCWHVRTTDCLEEREQEATAEDFFRHQLLLKFIRFWRKSAADQKAGYETLFNVSIVEPSKYLGHNDCLCKIILWYNADAQNNLDVIIQRGII